MQMEVSLEYTASINNTHVLKAAAAVIYELSNYRPPEHHISLLTLPKLYSTLISSTKLFPPSTSLPNSAVLLQLFSLKLCSTLVNS